MNKNDSDENEDFNSTDEECEQWLRANEQLRQQLVSLTSLSVSLAQQQAGDAMISFGTGVGKRWINARSVRTLMLARGHTVQPSYALMVDEIQVTDFLPPEDAEQVLGEAAELLNSVLRPPRGRD